MTATATKKVTPAQRRSRLRALKRRIATVPLHDFQMDHIGWRTSDCGTHACVAGHCVLMPEFRRAGGKATWMKSDIFAEREYLRATFPGMESWDKGAGTAARLFLGLSVAEHDRLFFNWNSSHTPRAQRAAKVKQIERMIQATKGA